MNGWPSRQYTFCSKEIASFAKYMSDLARLEMLGQKLPILTNDIDAFCDALGAQPACATE
jgi:hypothetical protein